MSTPGIPKQVEDILSIHRRGFLKTAGLLFIGFAAPGSPAADEPGPYPIVDPQKLDSWIVIHENNTATFYVGKTDPGQGTGTGFRQLMSDELDIAFDKTTCIMGSTDITVDQVGAGGSSAMERDSWPMRRAAAEARRVLLEMASSRFGVPVDQLAVSEGVITVKADPSKHVTYGELIGGQKFNVTLSGNSAGSVNGKAKTKTIPELKYAGKPMHRDDIPGKVDGTAKWAVDVKLPGMVHARNVKPPYACAKLTGIDESSVKNLPGFVKVMNKGNYVAVVCEREEQAIKAARQLKTTWEKPATAPFPSSEDLFHYLRGATPAAGSAPAPADCGGRSRCGFCKRGKDDRSRVRDPFPGTHRVRTGACDGRPVERPDDDLFERHEDVRDAERHRHVSRYAAGQGARGLYAGIAGLRPHGGGGRGLRGGLDCARTRQAGAHAVDERRGDRVGFQVARVPGEIARGSGCAGKFGRVYVRGPLVRLQSPGIQRAGYDADRATHGAEAGTDPPREALRRLRTCMRLPNRKMTGEVYALPAVWETPLRTGNLRDPNGPQASFASESFIDEVAAAVKADALEFRLKMLEAGTSDDSGFRRARSIAVLKAAAQKYGWDARPSGKPRGTGKILTGRGIAYTFRGQTMVAQIAEVEVNRETGHVWAKRMVCAHDCGFVVNPESLRTSVECGMLHGLSRALHEEVKFNTEKVTSVDWISHPTLRHADVPESIEIVMVNGDPNPNRPDLPLYGAGEACLKPTMAAVGNAIYDATGIRIRRVPFRPERVLAALKAAGV